MTVVKSLWSAMSVPLCSVQEACDGNSLTPGRTMCMPCEKKLKKKASGQDIKPKGEGPKRPYRKKALPT